MQTTYHTIETHFLIYVGKPIVESVARPSRAVNTCEHHKLAHSLTHTHVLFLLSHAHITLMVGFSLFGSQNIYGTRPFIPILCSCGICNKKCYFISFYLFSCLGFSISSNSSSRRNRSCSRGRRAIHRNTTDSTFLWFANDDNSMR